MPHHKRGKARNQRAGCKLCKPWKVNGARTERTDGETFSDHSRRHFADRDIDDFEDLTSETWGKWRLRDA